MAGGGGGGGGSAPMVALAASIRRNAALNTLPAQTRIAIPMDTVLYASSGMVDLVAHPSRITVTKTGLYLVEGIFSPDGSPSATEFVCNIFKNGFDSTGGHGGVQPAVQDEFGIDYAGGGVGTESPWGGFYVANQGTTTTPEGNIFGTYTCHAVVPANAGDFFFLSFQSDIGFSAFIDADPEYFQWSPKLSVTYLSDLPT